MKFTAEELMSIAISEYEKENFLKDREGIAEWADASTEEDYDSEDEVREEIRSYIAEEKAAEISDADNIVSSTGKVYNMNLVRMYMDDDICEDIRTKHFNQEFYERYCELHAEKYGEDFIFESENPQI